MNRRDRAALTLCLEHCRHAHRGRSIHDPKHIEINNALHEIEQTLRAVDQHVWADTIEAALTHWTLHPLVLARVAVLLRAVLRADAGDFGRHRSVRLRECAAHAADRKAGNNIGCYRYNHACGCQSSTTRRITPLWELAPSSGRGR